MEPAPQVNQPKKPRFALAIATCFGLGYIPKAPGTVGSLAGVGITWSIFQIAGLVGLLFSFFAGFAIPFVTTVLIALAGVWSSGVASRYWQEKDPPKVVIDEISGQQISLLPMWVGLVPFLNWKYLLLGFILFRVFDIWKPWPVRQAEKLPGGWGIMADDWVAGIYAALGLWIARALGL